MPSSLPKELYNPRPSSFTRHGCVRVAPIAQYSPLLPPVGVWAVSQSQCAGHPLRPARDRRLGEPLPHQLPNPTCSSYGMWPEGPTLSSLDSTRY